MNQRFEQRELPVSKKDFAISQYEEFVKKLEESLKIETQDMAVTYLEPSPSPEVDSLLNIFLRLNARLLNASSRIDFVECLNLDETEAFKEKDDYIESLQDKVAEFADQLAEKDEKIQTLKEELIGRSDQVEKLVEEDEGYHKAIRDLEIKIKELVKENEGLNRLVDSLQIPASNQATPSKKK